MTNSLIDLLAAYGPVPDGNAMYDERVRAAAAAAGHVPLSIPEKRSKDVADLVSGPTPSSVILTGTAGDGKTYTARRVFERLAPKGIEWGDEAEQSLDLDDRRVVFVKDLSELSRTQKEALLPRLLDAFTASAPTELFVLCANDGQLLRAWRETTDPRAPKLLQELAMMLQADREKPEEPARYRLVNMSRESRAAALDDVLSAVLDHPGWSGCDGACPGLSADTPCPIRLNRVILQERGSATMRTRLRHLVEIAAADDDHLSLRQVMIIVVNALLGDSKVPQTPLLTCSRAQRRAAAREYRYTNPFANVLGENHLNATRERVGAFAVLRRYSIGEETNNRFDDALLDPEPTTSLPDHEQYGLALIAQPRANYVEDPGSHIAELRPLLRDQRRRLFFTAPDNGGSDGPWTLTLLHAGSLYVSLLDASNGAKAEAGARRLILRGLNRVLSGALTETDDRLWLPQPSGAYLGRVVPLMLGDPIGWTGFGPHLVLERPRQAGRPPILHVRVQASADAPALGSLPLTPALFEYLVRVAHGALPTSFSNECLQEVRSFQIQVAGALEALLADQEGGLKLVQADGDQLQARDVGVLSAPVI